MARLLVRRRSRGGIFGRVIARDASIDDIAIAQPAVPELRVGHVLADGRQDTPVRPAYDELTVAVVRPRSGLYKHCYLEM